MIKTLLGTTFGGLAIVAFAWATLVFVQPVHAGECSLMRASYYGTESGHRTANGERFTGKQLTAAHRTYPFNTRLRVTYRGRTVIVRINDRGPAAWTKRSLDLSKEAARQLGLIPVGVGSVCVERLR